MASEETDPERLARKGYGWEDLKQRCNISERDARAIVFGKLYTLRWEKRRREAMAS